MKTASSIVLGKDRTTVNIDHISRGVLLGKTGTKFLIAMTDVMLLQEIC